VVAVVEVAMVEAATTRKAVWFYNLELALLADGAYHLSVAATTVDEEEPQLVCQEILDERVASIDDALARLKHILTSTA
jgi:hypothetical protein